MGIGVAVAACSASDKPASRRNSGGAGCDSAKAAQVALDSLRRLHSFASVLDRFERDSDAVRIVTYPAPGQPILDGAAIIRINPACRITSFVQTDSA